MMRKELGIIKLTAQFVARYGSDFWMALWDRVSTETQFQFLDRGHREDLRYKFFTQLAVDYSELIKRWENMPEKSDKARMDVVVEGFLAVFEAFKKKQEEEEDEVVVGEVKIERSDFDEYFLDIEKRFLPPPENGPQVGVPLHMMSSL